MPESYYFHFRDSFTEIEFHLFQDRRRACCSNLLLLPRLSENFVENDKCQAFVLIESYCPVRTFMMTPLKHMAIMSDTSLLDTIMIHRAHCLQQGTRHCLLLVSYTICNGKNKRTGICR